MIFNIKESGLIPDNHVIYYSKFQKIQAHHIRHLFPMARHFFLPRGSYGENGFKMSNKIDTVN